MARAKNNVDSIQITLSVTQAIRDLLDQLSDSGFYGKNAADTASVLLREKLRELTIQLGTPAGRLNAAAAAGGFPGGQPSGAV